ncbi:hypothetical protein D6D29_00157 [Aureobasidium pullulans]|nr:hypothetical protein D6D29_00157 [Aureobasidium pullulans]
MAPQLAPLARSDSKTKFFQRLGLSPERKSDNRLYELMKNEAVQGRERILSSPNSLLPQLRGDPDIRPPYSNIQICESAIHAEIFKIYREASPETKTMYEKGHDTESFNEENWIIRWMLWHVFRFRDSRNKPGKSSQVRSKSTSTDEAVSSGHTSNGYWDPVKDAHQTARN